MVLAGQLTRTIPPFNVSMMPPVTAVVMPPVIVINGEAIEIDIGVIVMVRRHM
jgi:hypothetical protein